MAAKTKMRCGREPTCRWVELHELQKLVPESHWLTGVQVLMADRLNSEVSAALT